MEDSKDNRDDKGRFIPGVSPNPKGVNQYTKLNSIVRQGDFVQREVQELYKEASPMVFQELLKIIMSNKTPPSPKVNAIKEFLNRAHGKPAIVAVIQDNTVYTGVDFTQLSAEALREIVEVSVKKDDDSEPTDA